MTRLALVMLGGLATACGDDGGSAAPDGNTQPDGPGTGSDSGSAVTTDTKSIGPAGGTLTIDGAELVIPPNALATTIALTLTKTANAAPSFVANASAVFDLTPSGTVFNGLVTLRITHATAPAANTKIFWNKLGITNPTTAADFETLLETTITGNVVEAKNNHFSDPLDGECLSDLCPELRCCSPEGVCGGCL